MPIDTKLIPSVSHYINGMIGAVLSANSMAEVKGKTPDLITQMKESGCRCINYCEDILTNPAKYAGQPDYQLSPEDKDFLQRLLDKSRVTNWQSKQEVFDLRGFVFEYCRI